VHSGSSSARPSGPAFHARCAVGQPLVAGLGDVRRVADDQVEALALEAAEQRAAPGADAHAVAQRVELRADERATHDVDGGHLRAEQRRLHGEQPAARADVEHHGALRRRVLAQRTREHPAVAMGTEDTG